VRLLYNSGPIKPHQNEKRPALPTVSPRRSLAGTQPAENLAGDGHQAVTLIRHRRLFNLTKRGGSWPGNSYVCGRAIPCSDLAQQRHNIIPNRVALVSEESVSVVTVGTAPTPTGDPTNAHLHHWQ
jgi:hypothetical protein